MSDPNPAGYPNSLAEYLCTFDIPWDLALNALQGAGIVSDNCISIDEVAEADCPKAIFFVNRNCKNLIERTFTHAANYRHGVTGSTERSAAAMPTPARAPRVISLALAGLLIILRSYG